MLEKIKKVLKNPLLLFVFLNNNNILVLSDKTYLKLRYFASFKKRLNLDNPKTFNEKLQWLKLYDRNPIYTNMVDKYEVKKYIAEKIGEEYIIPTIGIYNSWDEIDFEKLPEQFVIKCTHDSGSVIICKNKSEFNKKTAKRKIEKALKKNFFVNGREWPYKNVKPRIIIEDNICPKNCNNIEDFKLQTFNGKVAYSFVCTDRDTEVKFTFFDKEKNFINVTQCEAKNDPENAKLPKNYDEMVELAEKIVKDIPEARVDFYNVNDKVYFGELTFFDTSGFGKFEPEEWDYKFGKMLDLSRVNNSEK